MFNSAHLCHLPHALFLTWGRRPPLVGLCRTRGVNLPSWNTAVSYRAVMSRCGGQLCTVCPPETGVYRYRGQFPTVCPPGTGQLSTGQFCKDKEGLFVLSALLEQCRAVVIKAVQTSGDVMCVSLCGVRSSVQCDMYLYPYSSSLILHYCYHKNPI